MAAGGIDPQRPPHGLGAGRPGRDLLSRPEAFAWEEASIPTLFTLQENLIYADPSGRLTRLRQATAPARMPETQWRRALLAELEDLVDNTLPDLRKSAARGMACEAQIHLGLVIESLLHVGFLIAHRYYPWRTHLRWAFDRLTGPVAEQAARVDALAEQADWPAKAAVAQEIFDAYRRIIAESGCLPGVDLDAADLTNELIWANRCQAWQNPRLARVCRRAGAAGGGGGPSARAVWVWSLWGRTDAASDAGLCGVNPARRPPPRAKKPLTSVFDGAILAEIPRIVR